MEINCHLVVGHDSNKPELYVVAIVAEQGSEYQGLDPLSEVLLTETFIIKD